MNPESNADQVYVMIGITRNIGRDSVLRWVVMPAAYEPLGVGMHVSQMAQKTRGRWKWSFSREFNTVFGVGDQAPFSERLQRSYGLANSGDDSTYGQVVLATGFVAITAEEHRDMLAKGKPVGPVSHGLFHMERAVVKGSHDDSDAEAS